MRKSLILIILFLATASLTLAGQARILKSQENGHTVYVNDGGAPSSPNAAIPTPEKYSVLVYWSRKEHRWKPVPRPTRESMQAARSAVAEVSTFVDATPKSAGGQNGASLPPDTRDLGRGHIITSAEMDKTIEAAAKHHNVDPNLVRAMIKVESNYNPHAISKKGAIGLMQLMPYTAKSLNVSNAFDPQQNVEAGVRHLKSLLDNYHGNLELSLAAYNAGSGAVERNRGIPPYSETRAYVKKITNLYWGGNQSARLLTGPTSAPIRVMRDNDGHLVISNTD